MDLGAICCQNIFAIHVFELDFPDTFGYLSSAKSDGTTWLRKSLAPWHPAQCEPKVMVGRVFPLGIASAYKPSGKTGMLFFFQPAGFSYNFWEAKLRGGAIFTGMTVLHYASCAGAVPLVQEKHLRRPSCGCFFKYNPKQTPSLKSETMVVGCLMSGPFLAMAGDLVAYKELRRNHTSPSQIKRGLTEQTWRNLHIP